MKYRHAVTLALSATLGLAISCKKEPEAAPAEPTFTPGVIAPKTFEPIGVTLAVPDNVTADTSSPDKLVLSAPGFPTVTVAKGPKGDGMGRMGSAGSSGIKMKLMGPESTWTCESGPAGDHRKLIQGLCDSMAPKGSPHLVEPKCDTITGYDKAAVMGAITSHEKGLLACFDKAKAAKANVVGMSLSFSVSQQGGSYSSGESGDAANCLREVYSAITSDPLFKATAGEASCNVVVAAF
jgi:hypothetical protein